MNAHDGIIYQQGYKKGYEEGLNKAKEWNNSDEHYPTPGYKVLVRITADRTFTEASMAFPNGVAVWKSEIGYTFPVEGTQWRWL